MDSKQCTKCGEVKPLDEFHRKKSNKDGRNSTCVKCRNVTTRRWKTVAYKAPDGSAKSCVDCGEVKAIDDFATQKNSADGRRTQCNDCREKQRQRRLAGAVCTRGGCNNEQHRTSLCVTHYAEQRLAGTVCEIDKCHYPQHGAGLCKTHYAKQRLAGKVCEIAGCNGRQHAAGFCATHYTERRLAGAICETDDCDRRQHTAGKCKIHYDKQRLAGTVCELEGCDCQQRTAGMCNMHYQRLWIHGDPEAFAPEWDETTPTWVYLIQQSEEELVKAGIGFHSRIDRWRARGWTLVASVQLPRNEAVLLESEILNKWFDEIGMRSLHDHGDRREGATEMTDATPSAIDVARSLIEEARTQAGLVAS